MLNDQCVTGASVLYDGLLDACLSILHKEVEQIVE